MRAARPLIPLLGAIAVLAAACGGGASGSLSKNDVAEVAGIHVTQAQFDAYMQQAKRNYEQNKQPWPKAGTQEFAAIRNQAVTLLVQAAEREAQAKRMGIEISDKQVNDRLQLIKNQYFKGSDALYQQRLKQSGLTDEQVRADVRSNLVSEAIFSKVTSGVKVTNDDVHAYYLQHPQQYAQPQSRAVRHILVKDKALAEKLDRQLRAGGSWKALALRYSQDPGSKSSGGKLTAFRGQTVAPFEAAVFSLKTGQISNPVRTRFGWHVIQALGPVKPATTTPEAQVRETIRQQLLQTKKNEKMTEWMKQTDKRYVGKVRYQVGYQPPQASAATTTG